ncbi:MAG: hypothetical protein PVH11_02385 [Anaerolineae bacterium]|jgi:hypothetical protein
MESRASGVRPLWLVSVLVLALLTMVGCVEVEELDSPSGLLAPELESPLPEGKQEHNLAVLAVDFDPPLEYEKLLLRREAISMLVAIENTGDSTEQDVVVQAQLSSPNDPDLLLSQDAGVASIAPGEVQIVRFPPLEELPYHEIYHLEVMVHPVVGERDLGDNGKAFDIQILRK